MDFETTESVTNSDPKSAAEPGGASLPDAGGVVVTEGPAAGRGHRHREVLQ
jgi:hypothetical protein